MRTEPADQPTHRDLLERITTGISIARFALALAIPGLVMGAGTLINSYATQQAQQATIAEQGRRLILVEGSLLEEQRSWARVSAIEAELRSLTRAIDLMRVEIKDQQRKNQ